MFDQSMKACKHDLRTDTQRAKPRASQLRSASSHVRLNNTRLMSWSERAMHLCPKIWSASQPAGIFMLAYLGNLAQVRVGTWSAAGSLTLEAEKHVVKRVRGSSAFHDDSAEIARPAPYPHSAIRPRATGRSLAG